VPADSSPGKADKGLSPVAGGGIVADQSGLEVSNYAHRPSERASLKRDSPLISDAFTGVDDLCAATMNGIFAHVSE